MLTPFGMLPNRLASRMSMAEQYEWLLRQRLSRRTLLRGAGVAGASSLLLWAQPDRATADPSRVYGRHLAYGADPTTQMIVGFASRSSVHHATVHLDDGRTASAEIKTVAGSVGYYLRAHFDGLRPGTEYAYTLELDGTRVPGARFHTAPAGRTSFRFTAFGDQSVTTDAVQTLTQLARARPMFHLLAGDLCYADGSGRGGPGDIFHPARWDAWLAQNDPVTSAMPWMIVPGNHEMEPGFGMHGYAGMLSRVAIGGRSPLAIPVATSFRIGSVGFVGLDSNDVANEFPANRGWTRSRQTAWLEQQLADYRASRDIDFVVVFLHSSPYCSSPAHASEAGIRDHWVPLFDKYTVDLVISGHNHCYQRALPLRHGAVVSNDVHVVNGVAATSYVTVGGGGARVAGLMFGRSRSYARLVTAHGSVQERVPWDSGPSALDYCVLVVDVTPGSAGAKAQLRLRAISNKGAVLDDWQIVRHPVAGGSWLWPDGAAALGGLAAVGLAGTAVAVQRARKAAPPAAGGSAPGGGSVTT